MKAILRTRCGCEAEVDFADDSQCGEIMRATGLYGRFRRFLLMGKMGPSDNVPVYWEQADEDLMSISSFKKWLRADENPEAAAMALLYLERFLAGAVPTN